MKKKSGNMKLFFIFVFFSTLFFAWFLKVYLPEKNQDVLVKRPTSSDDKLIFGTPKKNGLVYLEYIGFIVGFDSVRKNPAWVAYNLKSSWLKADKILAERDFKPDPKIPRHWMADLTDFKRSGFDRGHMARQADMRGRSLLCEQEACYLVNISPQKAEFNQKTWLNLENAVQKWANQYGELWIITGPWFDGKKELLNRNTEIPDGFYKIVVNEKTGRFSFQSFIFEQNDRSLDLNKYAASIDSVEKLTGIDFFSELPDSLESQIEKRKFKLWSGWR